MGHLIIVDIWEADVHIDVPTLIAGGVDGMIVRLNSMSGGHHKDELFDLNWERAKQFPLQAAYFVYNPWVTGEANRDWVLSNLPKDYGQRRIFSDIEVVYQGYSDVDYGREVREYDSYIRNPQSKYTGAGYISLLDSWPGGSYWWARYPSIVAPPGGLTLTWEELQKKLDTLNFDNADPLNFCPGTVELWQCTDRVVMPGMSGRAIDISIYPGPIEEAKKFFNVPLKAVETVGMYDKYAKGLFLYEQNQILDAESLKGHVDFIVGEVGVGITPKPKFKEWAELAKLLDVPFIGFLGSDPVVYKPMTADKTKWGTAETDVTCKMVDAQRHYPSGTVVPVHGYIVDGSKYVTEDGKIIEDTWMAWIWDHTFSRVHERFNVPTFPFMKRETLSQKINPIPPNGTLINSLSNMAVVSTYRAATTKVQTDWAPVFIPADTEGPLQPYAPGWNFWWYGSTTIPGIKGGVPLFMYRGTAAELHKAVKFVPGGDVVVPPPPPPDPIPGSVYLKLDEALTILQSLPSNRYVSIAITEIEKLQAFIEKFVE